LERLTSGTIDNTLFDDAIHARPLIVTDRSRGFNEPIAIGTGETLAADKVKGKLKPTANMTVELQADAAFFDQDANNVATVGEIPDGAFFRRSRIGIFGELYETVEYRLEYDFANPARPQFLDNWVALTNIPLVNNVIVGHYFEPFSLERYSPNRFITFMERSLADTFAPKRNMGVMVYGNALERRLTYALGGFRSGSDIYGNDVSFNSGYAGTAHATYLAWYEEVGQDNLKLLHLGGSYSYRSMGDDPVHYSTRPSVRMQQEGVGGVPIFLRTGDLNDASHVQLYGLEAAWVHGVFSIQSELIAAEVHRKQNADPVFHGGYIFGSWFLTGESRSYSPTSILGRFREGIFQRTVPRSNVFDRNSGIGWTGAGAVELAVRWSYIDLNSSGVQGGFMEEMTYGINWYLNPYTKMMFNYVRPTLNDPVFSKSQANSYAMRVQFEF
jgi:phosphate-selective porin OprO/OprP